MAAERPPVEDRRHDPIRCHCGAVLADRVDGMNVVIDGVEFQFRRRSDHLTCASCGFDHPMTSLRGASPAVPDTGQRRRSDD